MSYELNSKLSELVPYEPITETYKIRLDANESFINLNDEIKSEILKYNAEISAEFRNISSFNPHQIIAAYIYFTAVRFDFS